MAWYISGTVAVANGSQTVIGAGTNFVANVLAGQGFIGQDGRAYEIANVVSATELTLRTAYYGGSGGGQSYAIFPTQSIVKDLADAAAGLINSFAAVRDGVGAGLIPDGTAAAPAMRFAADQDTGFRRYIANGLSIVTSGIDRLFVGSNGIGAGAAPDGKSGFLLQGVDQTTSALADAGTHGASLMLRANGASAGDGGALLFGATALGSQTPFAGLKGLLTNGNAGTLGDLAFVTRAAVGDGAMTERLRLTAAGYLGLGVTPNFQMHVTGVGQSSYDFSDNSNVGGALYLEDKTNAERAGGALLFGAASADNSPFAFVKGALTNGNGNTTGALVLGTRASTNATSMTGRWSISADGHFAPLMDNAYDLGGGATRVRTVYGATGSINTSDQRMKQQIEEIPAEWLDAWAEVRHVRFKFNEAVEEKGEDARWHLGFIAQEIKAAFDAKGIDATKIGLLCHDSWDEEVEPEIETVTRIERRPKFTPSASLIDSAGQPLGTWSYDEVPISETRPTGNMKVRRAAGDRWSLRYDECQALEGAWLRRELLGLRADVANLQATA